MTTLSNNDIAQAIYLVSKSKTAGELAGLWPKITAFLVRRRLLPRAPAILEKLETIINQEEGRIKGVVISPRKLTEPSKKNLLNILEKYYSAQEVVLSEKLDPKILGGIRIEIKDEVIDNTIKNKIEKLQKHLIKKYE